MESVNRRVAGTLPLRSEGRNYALVAAGALCPAWGFLQKTNDFQHTYSRVSNCSKPTNFTKYPIFSVGNAI